MEKATEIWTMMFSLRAKSLIWPAICGSIEHLAIFQVISRRPSGAFASREVIDFEAIGGAPGRIRTADHLVRRLELDQP